jgi:hypothetical protein
MFLTFPVNFLFIGEVRELSHLDMDEVLKTTGEIYEQEH